MTLTNEPDALEFSKKHIADLHDIWRKESPEFGYYPNYQDVNSKSIALIEQLNVFKGMRVLDIGCNSGLYSCLTGLFAKSVVGCDVESVLINRARSTSKYLEAALINSNVQFRQSSFTELLADDFDGILASLVLYHIGDAALDVLGEYLKKKRPAVVLQARPARAQAFIAHPEWKTVSNTKKYDGMFTMESNLAFLRDCGYESASVHGLCSTLFYDEYFPVIVACR